MGQSAGASSILHHITSNGGKGRPPAFQQAILQSPTFFPRDRGKADNTYNSILKAAGVANFTELQGLSTENLMYANAKTIYRSEYGQPVYGPVVDNTYVRDLPGRLLLKGEFHKDINAMIGHNRQEGTIFTPPWIRTRKEFKAHMLKLFPHFAVTKLNYLIEKLYVIPNSPLQEHRIQQVANAIGDVAVDCNVYYLTKASNKTYNYKFNLYPGFHGQDVSYTVSSPPLASPLHS